MTGKVITPKQISDLIEKYQDRKHAIMKLVHPGDNPIIETLRDIIFDLEALLNE